MWRVPLVTISMEEIGTLIDRDRENGAALYGFPLYAAFLEYDHAPMVWPSSALPIGAIFGWDFQAKTAWIDAPSAYYVPEMGNPVRGTLQPDKKIKAWLCKACFCNNEKDDDRCRGCGSDRP